MVIKHGAVLGRHDPPIGQELFDRVQRVLFNERRAGTRQRVHNHYLKGLLRCARCGQRLIVIPGRSKSGQQYFYYLCRGRQRGTCDFPYLHLSKLERLVEAHYATVQLSGAFRDWMQTRLDVTRASATTTASKLRAQLSKQLATLDTQEDRYLDLIGDPDWPKDKLSAKMRGIREERARIQERLTQADNPIDSGYGAADHRPEPAGRSAGPVPSLITPSLITPSAWRPARRGAGVSKEPLVGLRSHHANQMILVQGDPLPVLFARSRQAEVAR